MVGNLNAKERRTGSLRYPNRTRLQHGSEKVRRQACGSSNTAQRPHRILPSQLKRHQQQSAQHKMVDNLHYEFSAGELKKACYIRAILVTTRPQRKE